MTPANTREFDPARYLKRLGKGDYLEVRWRLVWFRTAHPDGVIETELIQMIPDPPMAIFRAKVSYTTIATDDEGMVLLDRDNQPISVIASATGWGQEEPKDFNDYLEKAETKALGRALAALGFGTQFTEDWDYSGDTGAVVDSPVQRQASGQQNPPFGGQSQAARPAPGQPNNAARPVGNQTAGAGQGQPRPVQGQQTASARPAPQGQATGPVKMISEAQTGLIYTLGRRYGYTDDQTKAECAARYNIHPHGLTAAQASQFIGLLQAAIAGDTAEAPNR